MWLLFSVMSSVISPHYSCSNQLFWHFKCSFFTVLLELRRIWWFAIILVSLLSVDALIWLIGLRQAAGESIKSAWRIISSLDCTTSRPKYLGNVILHRWHYLQLLSAQQWLGGGDMVLMSCFQGAVMTSNFIYSELGDVMLFSTKRRRNVTPDIATAV